MKSLNESQEYQTELAKLKKLEGELVERIAENRELEIKLSRPREKVIAEDTAWDLYNTPSGKYETDQSEALVLREELEFGRRREGFLERALEQGRRELDKIRSRESLKVCQVARPQFVKQIRRILAAHKEMCEANAELQKLRTDLEQDGARTGSLPIATFECGAWDDHPYGGSNIASYRRWVEENYPELKPMVRKSA